MLGCREPATALPAARGGLLPPAGPRPGPPTPSQPAAAAAPGRSMARRPPPSAAAAAGEPPPGGDRRPGCFRRPPPPLPARHHPRSPPRPRHAGPQPPPPSDLAGHLAPFRLAPAVRARRRRRLPLRGGSSAPSRAARPGLSWSPDPRPSAAASACWGAGWEPARIVAGCPY